MLELDLGVEDDAVGELVADVEHAAQVVGVVATLVLAVALVRHEVAVERLPVATDGEATLHAVDLGGGGAEPVLTDELRLGGHDHLIPHAGPLVRQHFCFDSFGVNFFFCFGQSRTEMCGF